MTDAADPFAHHPELRGRIKDAEDSFFRDFTFERLVKERPEMEKARRFFHTDERREAIRAETLAGHRGDLWVFAYGSLMWDPALKFTEVRRAYLEGYARCMVLRDDKGGRGTEETPGLMAALDTGPGCEGLAFRIAANDVERETEILFRREMIGPGYIATFRPARLDGGPQVEVLTFLADHDAPMIRPDLTRAEQVECLATGTGFLGSSRDYLANIVEQFDHLGIEDAHCAALLREVDAVIATRAEKERAG